MESRESQRDKRVRDVLNDKTGGNKLSPSASVMRAREEIQGIEAERSQNLERQKAYMTGRQQQLNTMKQAAMIGASGMAGGTVGGVLAQQAAGMNQQTQAILQKYGVKPGQKQQATTNKQTSTQTSQQGPAQIKTTTNNTTNNNTRNEIRIVQPQIPMRQQAIPMKQGGGDLNKFKAWLDSSFAKQNTQYEIQQKEYRKREWNLARNSSKLFSKLSESTKSLGEKMDPRNMGSTLGGQLKSLLFLFLATTISKWWKPLMQKVADFEAGFKAVFGLPMTGELQKGGAKGYSFVNKIKEFIGIDTKSEKGKNTSLIEGLGNVFSDGINRLIDTLKLFVEDRRVALQKIRLPEFQTPSIDTGGIAGAIGGMFGNVMKGVMAPGISYLGDILSALMGGSKGLQTKARMNLTSQSKDFMKKEYGGSYFTSGSTDMMGNLKQDSTYGMSQLLTNHLRDGSNTLHTSQIMTGLGMLDKSANQRGNVVINPGLLGQLGFNQASVDKLLSSGQAKYVQYKLIRVPKSEAEKDEYRGGSLAGYMAEGAWDMLNPFSWTGGAGAAGTQVAAGVAAKRAAGGFLKKAVAGAKVFGKMTGAGVAALGGIGAAKGAYDYASASASDSGYVVKAVPMSDPRPGEPTRLLSVSKEGFGELKRMAHVKEFSADDPSFQRWVEGRERANKVAMGVKGKLVYQNQAGMKALKDANQAAANYDNKMNRIWNDPDAYGHGSDGNFVNARDNSKIAISNGLSWMANGLSDFNFKLTGKISPEHIPAGEARENALRGIRYLMEKYGLSKEAAAGIAGVIQRESSWNPGAVNEGERRKGYAGYGRGLCQWSNEWVTKAFPEWYQRNYGVRKYPNEVPLEHQLDYLMSGDCGNGQVKKEFLAVIKKPGVTLEEATRAMYLGYENGSAGGFASFNQLAKIKAYGGAAGVTKQFADRSGAALGFYNILGNTGNTGYASLGGGSYSISEDYAEDSAGQADWFGNGLDLNFGGNLRLMAAQDIANTLAGKKVDNSLMLGDWRVGVSVNYLLTNVRTTHSSKQCAKSVRLALKAGGINDKGHPGSASDYIAFLPKRGFARINLTNNPQVGDIGIMPASKGHPHGHICMFTGSDWRSDFIQSRMVVYNGGNYPAVMFRYTGKGGSGTDEAIESSIVDSAVDLATGVISKGLAATSEFLGKAAEDMDPRNNKVNPDKFDTSSLDASQMAAYKIYKAQGAQEDSSGVFLQNGSNRVYYNLNSDDATSGLVTSNVEGVYRMKKDGSVGDMIMDQAEAGMAAQVLMSSNASKKVKKTGTGGKVIDFTLPGRFKDIPHPTTPLKHYINQVGGLEFNLYSVESNGSGFNTILSTKIPILKGDGGIQWEKDGKSYNGNFVPGCTARYPIEYEHTGCPKGGGSRWAVLFSKDRKIIGSLGGKTYEVSPWLSSLGVTITPSASELIETAMMIIRGELTGEKIPAEFRGLAKKVDDITKGIQEVKNTETREALGIDKENIDKSIKDYKSGKNKDNYTELTNGDVIDKSMGVKIGTVKNGKFEARSTSDIMSTSDKDINENLKMASANEGKQVLNASESYKRYKLLHDYEIGENQKAIKSLKARQAGAGTGRDISISVSDAVKNKGKDEKVKVKEVLDENGKTYYTIDTGSLESNTYENLISRLNKQGLYKKDSRGKVILDKNKKAVLKDKFTYEEILKLLSDSLFDQGGLFSKTSDRLKELYGDGNLNIDYSSKENFLKSFATPGARERAQKDWDEQSLLSGLEEWYGKKEAIEGMSARTKDWNAGKKDNLRVDEKGNLVHTTADGSEEAVGWIDENGKAQNYTPEDAAKVNAYYQKNGKQNKAREFRDKTAWYAAKLGGEVVDQKGNIRVMLGNGDAFVVNVNSLNANDTVDSILEKKKGKFYHHAALSTETNDIGAEYFGGGKWIEVENSSDSEGVYNNITPLESRLKNKTKNITENDKKKAFESSWRIQEMSSRIEAAFNKETKDTTAGTNAHLSNLEDFAQEEVDLLGIIAKNTDKDNKELSGRVDEITGRTKTLAEANAEKAYADRKKQIQRDVIAAAKRYGVHDRASWFKFQNQYNGYSLAEMADAGMTGWGKWKQGIFGNNNNVIPEATQRIQQRNNATAKADPKADKKATETAKRDESTSKRNESTSVTSAETANIESATSKQNAENAANQKKVIEDQKAATAELKNTIHWWNEDYVNSKINVPFRPGEGSGSGDNVQNNYGGNTNVTNNYQIYNSSGASPWHNANGSSGIGMRQ